MKILWLLNQGAGNVVETIPAYLCLSEHIGKENIDVRYMPQYPTDDIKKASFYPAKVEYITEPMISYYFKMFNTKKRKYYDYIIKPPFVYTPQGSFNSDCIDGMRENDSEVRRGLRIAEFFGAKAEVKKDYNKQMTFGELKKTKCQHQKIVLHNGGLNEGNWVKKKYPWFVNLAERLRELDDSLIIQSIGSKDEHIEGTEDKTGAANYSLNEIFMADFYIGTDTGTAHIAALVDKPGIVLYTLTDPNKNWDAEFHKSLTVINRKELECIPCQRGYHMIFCRECHDFPADCQLISIDKIMEVFKKWLNKT